MRARRLLHLISTVSAPYEIAYAAHTQGCTFLLDAEGICRRVVVSPNNQRRDAARAATRCVGAQFVAALDPSAAGLLAEKPRVGASMLFARTDDRGRISLVRTGHLTGFERYRAEDPFEAESLPSMSVETSAPPLAKSAAPHRPRAERKPELSTAQFLQLRDDEDEDDETVQFAAAETQRRGWTPPPAEPPPVPTIRKSTMLPPAADAGAKEASLSELARRTAFELRRAQQERIQEPAPQTPYPPRMRSDFVPRGNAARPERPDHHDSMSGARAPRPVNYPGVTGVESKVQQRRSRGR